MSDEEDFLQGYADCAKWLGMNPETGETEEADDVSPVLMEEMRKECRDFFESQEALIRAAVEDNGAVYSYASAGHDFYLTRNGHGAGYWDRGLGVVGEKLTKASKFYGSTDNYYTDVDGVLRG